MILNKYKHNLLITVLLTSQIFVWSIVTTSAQDFDLKIEGSIVMYDSFPRGFFFNYCGATSIFVVKISKVIDGGESSQYILMITMHEFKKNQFNVKKIQHFNLTRIMAGDNKVRNYLNFFEATDKTEAITWLKLSKGAKLADIALDEVLPAYLFRGNDFPIKWWQKTQKPSKN